MWRLVFVLGLLASSTGFAAESRGRLQVGIIITAPVKAGAISPQATTGTISPRQPTENGSAIGLRGSISPTQGVQTPSIAATGP